MPLSWNEIRDRSIRFRKKWESEFDERAEAKSFWDDFFEVFGVSRRRVASFEKHVHLPGERHGFIDLLWKGVILVEHKSRGKDLDRAYEQAKGYFPGLKEHELPKYILTSDFDQFRLYDLEAGDRFDFHLSEFPKYVKLFSFMAGYIQHTLRPEDPINVKAAEKMARIHDQLKASGYEGHDLEVYLVRLLFCFFADDTGIFEKNQFIDYLSQRTREDGNDLGERLSGLFDVLNIPEDRRQKNLDEQLTAFRYVNGGLFSERLPTAAFDRKLRDALLESASLDWSGISPAIFGSLFQGVMDPKVRRNLGAHYTSEKNILKLIGPLFLEELWGEFEKVKRSDKALREFHAKLASLKFFDPACGCGNFLVVTYRELRELELEVLKVLYRKELEALKLVTDIGLMVKVNVSQFYGIEIEEFPARIAETALWLTDHQMNLKVSEAFGETYVRLPLTTSPNIRHGVSALRVDWEELVSKEDLSYILGNPPFIGSKMMTEVQREEILSVCPTKGAGVLDYVTGWYFKAAKYIQGTSVRVAFVSTNSICQGEQVAVLWGTLRSHFSVRVFFAHQTFRWSNEAKGVAAVYCVIVGFSAIEPSRRRLFTYEDISAEPHETEVSNINAYLVDAPDVFLPNRTVPLCQVPLIGIGNKPIDNGNYLFTAEEKQGFVEVEPQSEQWFRRWLGADQFLNGIESWYLWLGDCPPNELRRMPEVMKRVEAVKEFRLSSKSAPTRKIAATPARFHVENIPSAPYLLIPRHSSERRRYIPFGYIQPDTLTGDSCLIISGTSLFHFGVLTSGMHMAWVRYVCGRLKSDYRYSGGIVYNNFPWPEDPSSAQKKAIETAAREVLDARRAHPGSTLADLYDPLSMPKDLVKAHSALDKAVDAAYSKKSFASESERVAFLFDLYLKYTAPLAVEAKARQNRVSKRT